MRAGTGFPPLVKWAKIAARSDDAIVEVNSLLGEGDQGRYRKTFWNSSHTSWEPGLHTNIVPIWPSSWVVGYLDSSSNIYVSSMYNLCIIYVSSMYNLCITYYHIYYHIIYHILSYLVIYYLCIIYHMNLCHFFPSIPTTDEAHAQMWRSACRWPSSAHLSAMPSKWIDL